MNVRLSGCQVCHPTAESRSPDGFDAEALRDLQRVSAPWPGRAPGTGIDRPVQIREFHLVVVTRGLLAFDAGAEMASASDGDGLLVVPQLCRFTAIPDAAGRLEWWSFPTSLGLLRKLLNRNPGLEARARPSWFLTRNFKFRGLSARLGRAGITNPRRQRTAVLQSLISGLETQFYIFLAHHFFMPRRELSDLLKGASQETAAECAGRYPGGIESFRSAFQFYYGCSPEDWLRRPNRPKEAGGVEKGLERPGVPMESTELRTGVGGFRTSRVGAD